jgi:ABC-type Mn2+/Zn2+ transport system ATPase subunit
MKFKIGEMIVRDDTEHPKGTLVVDRHDQEGNMRAYPLGGGLELIIPAGDVARFSVVTKDEATPIYRKARFTLEGIDDLEFEGWAADKCWNGWAMPSFEIQQATKLAGLLEDQLRYDPGLDAFIGSSGGEEEIALAVQHEKTTEIQANERITELKSALKKLDEVMKPLEASVSGSEFKTLTNLRTARIAADSLKEIENLQSGLKQRKTAAEALLQQAREDITALLDEKVLEGADAASFKGRQTDIKKEYETLLINQTTDQNEIKTDDENRKLRNKKEQELKQDRSILVVWKRLRELVGSQDGSKFRRYAQTISLDVLTRHANRHLAKLSDRYWVCRDEKETLNLQIEDLHQAGVRRPMASLSGGESFLVSLALALGLSDLAGRTVRVDSLFIDEGFGNLDSETLEIAIAALESLRQNNKTVGVISHVALLKERISTQIVVEKMLGGISQTRIIPKVPVLKELIPPSAISS